DPAALWAAFTKSGRFDPPQVGARTRPTRPGETFQGALAAHATLAPGQEATLTFLLTWHFANAYFQGNRVGNRYAAHGVMECRSKGVMGTSAPEHPNTPLLHHSVPSSPALRTASALARDGVRHRDLLARFHEAVYDSTLPYWLLDCLTSQASTIRSEVCVWLADGTFAGYEGAGGCCPMNCSHVWGYEQTLAHLFPEL